MAKVVAASKSVVKTLSGGQDLPLSLTHISLLIEKVSFLWNKVYYHQTSKCLHMSASDLETSHCIELTKPLWSCRLSDVWQRLFLTFYDVIALSIWKLVSPFGVQMLLRVMQPSGHEMRSNLVSNNLMALTRRSNHDLVSGCRNCFLQTIPCPGADDATFAPEKSIYSCSDFYESNHLLSLSLPRFYDWFYFLGVHVSELIWTDWCIGQEEARLKF